MGRLIKYTLVDGPDDSSLDSPKEGLVSEDAWGSKLSASFTGNTTPRGFWITLVLSSFFVAVITGLMTYFLVVSFYQDKWVDCGNSTLDARARGCKFDLMMASWLNPACIDEPLSQQFLEEGKWKWYQNSDGTNELSHEKALLGEHPHIYADSKFHAMHCKYLIEKLSRAIANKRGIDDHSWKPGTIEHCTRMLLHFDDSTYKFTYRNGSSLRTSFKECRIP